MLEQVDDFLDQQVLDVAGKVDQVIGPRALNSTQADKVQKLVVIEHLVLVGWQNVERPGRADAVVNPVAGELGHEVVHLVQERGIILGAVVFVANSRPCRVGGKSEADGVDPVAGPESGHDVGVALSGSEVSLIADDASPEFDGRAVLELEVVSNFPDTAMLAGRFI